VHLPSIRNHLHGSHFQGQIMKWQPFVAFNGVLSVYSITSVAAICDGRRAWFWRRRFSQSFFSFCS
jgi:hypothetical protein